MTHLWLTESAVAAMGGRLIGAPPEQFSGISIDSRTLQSGDAFFAITGERTDGHKYLTKAFGAGAALAVVEQSRLPGLGHLSKPVIVVDNVLTALEELGKASRHRMHGAVIGVTGSVGKTSTKEMLRLMLAESGETHASVASYNNHWGVPLTLARMPASAAFGVFEIGMNHAGEITPLTQMVSPQVAMITTVAPVHLEFFENEEAIADAKAEIFTGVTPGGAVVLNRDNRHYDRLKAKAEAAGIDRIFGFGESDGADAQLLTCKMGSAGSNISCRIRDKELDFVLSMVGKHQALNAVGALLAADLLGADVESAAQALLRMTAPAGRGARHKLQIADGAFTVVDESYNANPASMRSAIQVLGDTTMPATGRRLAILGDMLELGDEAAQLHAALASPLTDADIDMVFCAGPLMRNLFDALPPVMRGAHTESSAELAAAVLSTVRAGDVVMVKGSLGSKMAVLIDALKANFPPVKSVA